MLVTNSGGPPAGPASGFDDAAWLSAVELLLLSAVRTIRIVRPSLEARGGGSILMLTSSSVKNPIPNLGLSNVVRPSVAALVKTYADEFASKKIRVNQLVPGRIATERLAYLDEANAKKAGIAVEEQRKKSMAAIPMGRYGEPEEFARAAAFLLSPGGRLYHGRDPAGGRRRHPVGVTMLASLTLTFPVSQPVRTEVIIWFRCVF